MIKRIRVATPEEVEKILTTKDGRGGTVLALDAPEGILYGVIRTAVEVDPILYPEGASIRTKTVFQRDIETVLAAQGVSQYYFNIHCSNESMLSVAKTFGAIQQSTEPEFRFVKVL